MIVIPNCLKNDYLHIGKIRNFCANHGFKKSDSKKAIINRIIEYAGDDTASEEYKETYNWLLGAFKEGSKEFCYKKFYFDETSFAKIETKIRGRYPNCADSDLLKYRHTENFELVNYNIQRDSNDNLYKVSLLFSKKVLEGTNTDELGETSVFPVYIDIYIDKQFIVSRCQAKSTLYIYDEEHKLYRKNRIKTIDESIKLMNNIVELFDLQTDNRSVRHKNCKMMFKLYEKYSFTPHDIKEKIISMATPTRAYIKNVFTELNLNPINAKKALQDMNIFLEKFISINGDMEDVFKKDRDAYLIKIVSDDRLQMTKMDTSSALSVPLQCTDTFFDGKKTVINSKECKKLNLCYNRNRGELGPYPVSFYSRDEYGVIKTKYYTEECDIENVLQEVFENY